MSTENLLLSKVVDEKCFYMLGKFNITEDDFFTQKETYTFIKEYCNQYGECPSFTTVVAECDQFEYEPEVSDNIEYMCRKLKSDRAKRESFNLLQNEAGEKFNSLKGDKFIEWLKEETDRIIANTQCESNAGINWATNGEERKADYLDVKGNKDKIIIKTPYPSLNAGLGGGTFTGDYILIEAYTNKGKSWIASDFGLSAWKQGNSILHYSPELSKYMQAQRLDTLNGHFNNMAMRNGELYESVENEYFKYLEDFNDKQEHAYIIKTMEDLPSGLSVDIIEADLEAHPEIKMVIVDGFNLMVHKGRGGLRENMTKTSRRLRQLCGRHNVTLLLVHQISTEGNKQSQLADEDGVTIVNPPSLEAYSETIAVIQDACVVLTYDYYDNEGALRVVKTRSDNKEQIVRLDVNYNEGYITEFNPDVF